MRGTVDPKDLLFNPEIEKTARANRKEAKLRKQREQRVTAGETSVQPTLTQSMGENPPRRTLGDFGRRNQGVQAYTFQPVGAVAFEIKSSILNALKSEQFSGSDAEDPNQHLFQFYEICGSTNPAGVTEDQKKLRLFPYTLTGRAKDWLNTIPAGTINNWGDLESKFLERFFPISKFIKKRAEISNFEQGDSESLYDSWERFKLLLKKCPGHGIDDFLQLQTFCHGLRPQTRMMLDASAGGSLGTKTWEEAKQLVEDMTLNEYMIQNDRGAGGKKGMLELDSNSAVLAQQKLMSMQIEALTKQVAAALEVGSQTPMQVGSNGTHLEDALTQCMQMTKTTFQSQEQAMKIMEKNHETSMKNLEGQIRQLSKKLAETSNSGFPASTSDNLKYESCKAISVRSGRELNPVEVINPNHEEVENELSKKNEGVVKSNQKEKLFNENLQVDEKPKGIPSYMKLPYPQLSKKNQKDEQFSKFMDIFKRLQINIPFAEALEKMPVYAKFMKELLTKKRKFKEDETVALTEECSAIIQRKLPPKLKDPGSFTIPCTIGKLTIGKALCDLGASINLMPLSMLKKLGGGEVKPTRMSLQLADRSIRHPYGVLEDVLVKVDKFLFPVDFVVLDMEEDNDIPLILGRPFLATSRAVIDVADGTLTLRVQDEAVTFNVLKSIDPEKGKEGCYYIETLDPMTEKRIYLHSPLENSLVVSKDFEEGGDTKEKVVGMSVDPSLYSPNATSRKRKLELKRKCTQGALKEAPEKQSSPPEPN